MKTSTFLGIIFGFMAIFGGFMLEGGNLDSLFMGPAILIVVGGTLAAGLTGSSFAQLFRLPRLFAIAFNPIQNNKEKILRQIVELSILAKKEGILSVENRLSGIENRYLRKFFKNCIDGMNKKEFSELVETETEHLNKRHQENIDFITKLGGYAPTMGIIGTVVGLISTLSAVGSDPNELIHHIAGAFIATLWGIVTANVIWLPLGDKLRRIHDDEIELIQIMNTGVQAVIAGDNPSIIRAKLLAAFPLNEQERLLKLKKTKKTEGANNAK